MQGQSQSAEARPGVGRRGWWLLTRPAVSMTAVAAAVLFAGLGQGDLRLDGSVYGWVSKRMALTGDWLNPCLDWGAAPYFNKPPLQFWMAAALCRLFGASDVSVRLPSAAFGLGCVLLTYAWARRRHGAATAATAGIVLATTYTFVRNTVGFRLDAGLTFCFLAALLAGRRILESAGPPRAGGRLADLPPWIVLGAALGAGLMIKGGGVLLAVPVLVAGFLLAGRPTLALSPRWVVAFAVALAVAAPWHLYMAGRWGRAFTDVFFREQVAERLHRAIHGRTPWYFYLRGNYSGARPQRTGT
jgi:4-amino-4-deoxy-L-arabinose transferase-like glycosyltransferase